MGKGQRNAKKEGKVSRAIARTRVWRVAALLALEDDVIALVPGLAATAVPHGVRWIPVRDQGDGLRRQVCAVTTHDASPAARAMVRALEDEATHSV